MYAITATVETRDREWTGSKQIPTFYLDERVQGIVNEEHAVRIAFDILTAVNAPAALHITAVKV